MAQEWARWFYNSGRWKKARRRYYENKHGICERCGAKGLIVHHKIPITPENIHDDNITLNDENFELLCQDCHNSIDHQRLIDYGTEERVFTADGDFIPPPV